MNTVLIIDKINVAGEQDYFIIIFDIVKDQNKNVNKKQLKIKKKNPSNLKMEMIYQDRGERIIIIIKNKKIITLLLIYPFY